jgi:hypothetical protein
VLAFALKCSAESVWLIFQTVYAAQLFADTYSPKAVLSCASQSALLRLQLFTVTETMSPYCCNVHVGKTLQCFKKAVWVGVTVTRLRASTSDAWKVLHSQLFADTYSPKAVLRRAPQNALARLQLFTAAESMNPYCCNVHVGKTLQCLKKALWVGDCQSAAGVHLRCLESITYRSVGKDCPLSI